MLTPEEIEKLEKFHRYLDKDGDGITYRTLPGVHPKGAYFTRGSGHTQYGAYTEDSADYQLVLDRLLQEVGHRRRSSCRALSSTPQRAATSASSHWAAATARSARRSTSSRRTASASITCGCARFRSREDVERFLAAHRLLFVVEQNRDAQFRSLLTLETAVEKAKLRSLLHYDGLPISSTFIVEGVLAEVQPRPKQQPRDAVSR